MHKKILIYNKQLIRRIVNEPDKKIQACDISLLLLTIKTIFYVP